MRIRLNAFWSIACALALTTACSDDGPGDVVPDSGPGVMDGGGGTDGGVSMRCGNGMLEGSEACDDLNTDPDDGCSATCELECGDGTVNGDEICDTDIAAGEAGACPTECDDDDACTTDGLAGGGCAAECVYGQITAATNGDGCCPSGVDATTDDDCASICGNGVVEAGESCDTDIAAGETGACATTCDDGIACTTDMLTGTACTAACTNVEITTPSNGDGCCPVGGTAATDDDCTGCGDGAVVAPETCDTGIATGAGACPTAATCNDAEACTTDTLIAGGTCMAACAHAPIAAGPSDGCCPTGATIGTDGDCAARCGDGIVTAPETCEPPGTVTCSATCQTTGVALSAFRFTDLDLMEPHVYATAPILGCTDVTNLDLFGNKGVNPLLQDNITMDGDTPADGLLDLSLAQVFGPLVQAAGTSTPSFLAFPDCTAPMSSTVCTLPVGAARTSAPAMNMGAGATCLGILPMTARPYSPAIVSSVAPAGGGTCFVASAGMVSFNLAGIVIALQDAQIAGEWSGAPATQIVDGLIRGFISLAAADATIIPPGTTGIASIDGHSLSSLFRGGAGNCSQPAPMPGDLDTLVGTTTRGWYVYLNYRASLRPYSEL